MTPEQRLEGITKEFEAQFETVTVYDPAVHPRADRCPTYNLPYLIFHNGIAKEEGGSSPAGGSSENAVAAVEAFRYHLARWPIAPARRLFWRVRPELESGRSKYARADRHRVYCRAVWV